MALGWRQVRLDEVSEVRTGIALGKERPIEGALEVPYLRVANVQDGRLDLSEIKTIGVSPEDSNRYSLKPGDVLLTEGGDFDKLGRGCVWNGKLEPCLHQNHVFAVRANRSRLLPAYLAYYAASPIGKTYFLSCAKQTTNLASINSRQLRNLPLLLPDVAEQRKIAAILSSVDEAIEGTQAVIDQLQVVKKAMMADLLTRGIPGRHKTFKQTEIGEVPAEWEVVSVGSLFETCSGGTPARDVATNWGGKIPWVKTGEIDYQDITQTEESISCLALDNSAAKLLPSGTLLMAMYGQGATRGRVALLAIEAACNQACLAFLPGPKMTTRFLFHIFSSKYEELRSLGHEGTQKNLNAALVREVVIPCPHIEEQEAIGAVMDNVDSRMQVESAQLQALREVKSALMSVLLTGEVRVRVDEESGA